MASRATRAFLASQGDFSLCPLPQVHLAEGELAEARAVVWSRAQALSPVFRERHDGKPELIAEGYDRVVPMRVEVAGQLQHGTERRLGVRSVRQAQAAEAAWRARVAHARVQIEALHQRGRGTQCCEEVSALRQAVGTSVQRDGVAELLWVRLPQHATPRAVRASRARPARVEEDRHATVEVCVDEAALEAAVRRLGWGMYGTNQPAAQ